MRSAGNLLGTTRSDQPGPLGGLPMGRTAKSSAGVRDSSPGQKGQRPFDFATGAGAKSEGRRARSVEMMTQRPTTGSLRSSGTGHVHLFLRPRLRAREPRRALSATGIPSKSTAATAAQIGIGTRGLPGEAQGGGDGAHAFRHHGRGRLGLGRGFAPAPPRGRARGCGSAEPVAGEDQIARDRRGRRRSGPRRRGPRRGAPSRRAPA